MFTDDPPLISDADIETAEWHEAGRAIDNEVCPICDEALRPLDPKWASSYTNPRYTAEAAARCVGPVSEAHPQYHEWCINPEDEDDWSDQS